MGCSRYYFFRGDRLPYGIMLINMEDLIKSHISFLTWKIENKYFGLTMKA